jgi:hypothetical protein
MVAGWLGSKLSLEARPIPEVLDGVLRGGMRGPAYLWEPVCGDYLRGLEPERRSTILEDVAQPERLTLVESASLPADAVVDECVVAAWLRTAMVQGRRWRLALWRHRFFDDPVMSNLVRGLVWGVFDEGALLQTLRVDGEGSLVDAEADTVELSSLPESVTLGVVHVVEMDAVECTRWSQHLAEFEEMPLFEQLARPTQLPGEGEWLSLDARWSREKLGRLREQGWRDRSEGLQKRCHGFGVTAIVPYRHDADTYVPFAVRFARGYAESADYGLGLSLARVSRVLRSEIVYELHSE